MNTELESLNRYPMTRIEIKDRDKFNATTEIKQLFHKVKCY